MLLMTAKVIVASIIALAGSGATYQYISEKLDEQNYPPIGRMIDVGGYKLHMIDSGQTNGGLTIVMDAGLGCNSLDWQLVQPEIAKFARVVSYDRAGYAWSNASPLPRTSENIVEELHTMLKNANIQAPYILVGHSFGGITMQLFAKKYPDEVAGVVLVDSSHEDQFEKMFIPDMSSMFWLIRGAFYLGIARLSLYIPSEKASLDKFLEQYPADIQKVYVSHKSTSKFINTSLSENLLFKQSCKQLQAAGGLLDDKPLTVIAQGKSISIEEATSSRMITAEQAQDFNKVWPKLQADLVTKSSRGKLMVAENSGHMIPQEQPQIIIDAVREMVEELTK